MMLNNRVTSVKPIRDFILEITFKDGKTFALDFRPMVESGSGWLYEGLKDSEVFRKVKVNGLTLEWPTGLDFCPDGLRYCCEVGRMCSDAEIADAFARLAEATRV
jgi:uncharacterized protein DUF2442